MQRSSRRVGQGPRLTLGAVSKATINQLQLISSARGEDLRMTSRSTSERQMAAGRGRGRGGGSRASSADEGVRDELTTPELDENEHYSEADLPAVDAATATSVAALMRRPDSWERPSADDREPLAATDDTGGHKPPGAAMQIGVVRGEWAAARESEAVPHLTWDQLILIRGGKPRNFSKHTDRFKPRRTKDCSKW